MGLIENPTYSLLERVLAYRNTRQGVIASNIANLSTPGYRAFDAVLAEQLGTHKSIEMRRTQSGHMSPDAELERAGAELVRSKAAPRLDGNNVSLDDEMLKLMENRLMHQVAFELLDKWGGLTPIAREVR